jgi:outer membrane protein assembly factor BamA
MARLIAPLFRLLAVVGCLTCSVLCRAQFPSVPERCSMRAHPRKIILTWRRVIIKSIDFDGPIHLSQSDVARIIKETNQKVLNADDPDWIKDFTKIGLRDAWETHGYFTVNATAKARSMGGNSNEERFLVTAHVEEGLQYHLRDIRFRGDSTVPETELRAAIPIRDGEIFSVPLIRNGIEALTKMYGSHGYIDFTAVPDTEIDNDRPAWISLVFVLDQQRQYRVGKVEVMASNQKLEARLRGVLSPGAIYNSEAVEDFFRQNEPEFPFGMVRSDEMQLTRNFETGIVDLTFDIRTCP